MSDTSDQRDDSLDEAISKRRQLLKKGALLVPAVLTLHARPALASQTDGSYGYANYILSNGQSVQGGQYFHTQQEAHDNSDPGAWPMP